VATYSPLSFILLFGLFDRLPLRIAGMVSAARTEGRYVVDDGELGQAS